MSESQTTVYIVERYVAYEGSSVTGIYTDENQARRAAFDESERDSYSDRYTVTTYSGAGKLSEGDTWEAPKRPTEPELPREYVEAQQRYQERLEEYQRDSAEFA